MHCLPVETAYVILAQSTIHCRATPLHNLHGTDVWNNILESRLQNVSYITSWLYILLSSLRNRYEPNSFWKKKIRHKQQDLFNAMGSMYAAVLFLGIQNCSSVQPVVAVERTVFYRERAAGMYSALPYAIAQVSSFLKPHKFLCNSHFFTTHVIGSSRRHIHPRFEGRF